MPDQKNNYVNYGNFHFVFRSLIRTFMSFHAMKVGCIRKKSKNILFFHSFALSLASPKVLRLGNKNKYEFILYCAQLLVPLHPTYKE